MAIGDEFPSEAREWRDPETGRTMRQLTAGKGHEYHLYFQAYSLTADGRWLVFCSERDGTTQLYRLDRQDGTITQLTAGRADKTGWWPWTSMDFQGVHGFIACLNPTPRSLPERTPIPIGLPNHALTKNMPHPPSGSL